MAMTPTPSAAPMLGGSTPIAEGGGGADDVSASPADGSQDEAGDENVLLTVCKEADGTYSLIKGDEQDADGADAAGSAADSDKQSFDSKGALLKGILDILNADEDSSGADGASGDQFQAGFDDAKPASPMPQKY